MTNSLNITSEAIQLEADKVKLEVLNAELCDSLVAMLEQDDAKARQQARASLRKAGITI